MEAMVEVMVFQELFLQEAQVGTLRLEMGGLQERLKCGKVAMILDGKDKTALEEPWEGFKGSQAMVAIEAVGYSRLVAVLSEQHIKEERSHNASAVAEVDEGDEQAAAVDAII